MKIRVLLGAWLLAIASGAAYALGLGEIIVHSRLNQPLNAEILVREAVPGEAEQLVAKLAAQEDFDRVGLERSRMPVMLRFETGTNARGQTVIKVSSDEAVREPFLTLLVEANWSGGRLLREYGVLLDPPISAPASTIARTAPPQTAPIQPAPAAPPPRAAAAPTPAQTSPLASEPVAPQPAPAPAPSRPAAPPAPSPPPPAAQPAPSAQASAPPPGFAQPAPTRPRSASAPAPTPAPTAVGNDGAYTVQRGDTLYGIAREFAADAGVSPDQMMLALQRDNTSAFFADNINNLKAGAVLRIPDADGARGVSSSEATAEVRRQNQTWSTNATAPALADAGAAPTRTITAQPPPVADARLELLPPAGDASSGNPSAGRAGNEQGGTDVAEVQAELQRAREDLRSRDQEVGELGSRVRDLEELNAKNARLLELKNAEVAELQRRLADAGTSTDAADAVAATPSATETPVEAPDSAVQEAAPGDDAATTNGTARAATDTADETTESSPAASTEIADNGSTPLASDTADTISSVGNEDGSATGDVAQDTSPTPAATADDVSEAEWEASATSADADPFADSQDTAPASADSWTPGEPEAATPAPAATPGTALATPVEATTDAQPWYMQPMVQGAGLIGLALILLLVMLARRQRKPALDPDAPKRSVSDLFVESGPVAAGGIGGAAAAVAIDDTEEDDAIALQAQISRDPDDFGAYLELLSLYYAEGDRNRFELWAERFYERPGSDESVEWEQVEGMGEELLPDHPLFGGDDDLDDDVIVDEESQVANPTWTDEPMTPVTSRFDESDLDDDVVPQPAAPVAGATRLSSGETRRVYDIGGTDFALDVGNDDANDDDGEAPIEFSLDDLDRPAPARPEPVTQVEARDDDSGDALPPLTFGGDETPVPVRRDENPADRGFETVDFDGDGESDRYDGGMDDAATKLELARAYLDMGDPDGARAMLEEVLGEGDTSQRDEARKLLATL